MSRDYLLVTPCRNEAAFARVALASVGAQTVLPALWIIVDDGSTDETPEILAEFAAKHPYVRVVRKPDRGTRSVGPGVVEAFEFGLAAADRPLPTFVCKHDLDLELPPRYFELLIERMEANARLGSCSGKPYVRDASGNLAAEPCGDEMSVGMTKFYRRACLEQIGGFVRGVMWDGIDCHRARMLGWHVRSWDEPELQFVHLRPMGSSDRSVLVGRARHGFGQYFMGTGFSYMLASAVFRARTPPFVLGSLAMLWGYVEAALRRRPRYDDREFRVFLRRFQWSCLLRGKRRTIERFERVR